MCAYVCCVAAQQQFGVLAYCSAHWPMRRFSLLIRSLRVAVQPTLMQIQPFKVDKLRMCGWQIFPCEEREEVKASSDERIWRVLIFFSLFTLPLLSLYQIKYSFHTCTCLTLYASFEVSIRVSPKIILYKPRRGWWLTKIKLALVCPTRISTADAVM